MGRERISGFVYEPLSDKQLPVRPCPFCGGADISVGRDDSVFLQCMNCGARGPGWDYREERAIYSWNKWR